MQKLLYFGSVVAKLILICFFLHTYTYMVLYCMTPTDCVFQRMLTRPAMGNQYSFTDQLLNILPFSCSQVAREN